LFKKSGVSHIQQLFDGFEDCMKNYGIGSVSEVHNGNPPHTPGGATSFALSVAALLRVSQLLKKFNN